MIYALVHPDTLEIRYVGKSQRGFDRMTSHRCAARTSEFPVYRWWRKLVRTIGAEPVMIRLGDGDSDKEIEMISHLRTSGARLLNCTDGGDGGPGYIHSPEAIAKIRSAAHVRKHTPQARKKIGFAHRGKTVSIETRAKMSASQRARRAVHTHDLKE